MLCEFSKQFESLVINKIKNDLSKEIDRLDALAVVYSDRDRERYNEIMQSKRELEMQLLEVM